MEKKRERQWEPLSLSERQVLWVMRSKRAGIREILRALKRSASTVSRELRRNAAPAVVARSTCALGRARLAHERACERRRQSRRGRRRRRLRSDVYAHPAERLCDGWSPEAIVSRMPESFPELSVSTVYRILKRDHPQLREHLPERGKPRRTRAVNRRSRFCEGAPLKRSITARPTSIALREEAGHFEGDTIVGVRNGSKEAVVSVCERRTRMRWYVKVSNLEASTVRRALMPLLHSVPEHLRKTITLDNGGEFAEWVQIERVIPGMKV